MINDTLDTPKKTPSFYTSMYLSWSDRKGGKSAPYDGQHTQLQTWNSNSLFLNSFFWLQNSNIISYAIVEKLIQFPSVIVMWCIYPSKVCQVNLSTLWTSTKLMYFETFVLLYFHFTLLYTSTFERKFVFYCTKLTIVTCYITQIKIFQKRN